MTDPDFDPEDYEGIQERTRQLPVREIKRFEKDRRERDELKAKLATFERREAFLKAGIPVDSDAGQMFMRGYEGDAEPDAIKQRWSAIFPDQGEQQKIQQSLTGAENSRQMASGAETPGQGDELMTLLRSAKSSQEVAQIMHNANQIVEPQRR